MLFPSETQGSYSLCHFLHITFHLTSVLIHNQQVPCSICQAISDCQCTATTRSIVNEMWRRMLSADWRQCKYTNTIFSPVISTYVAQTSLVFSFFCWPSDGCTFVMILRAKLCSPILKLNKMSF